MRKCYHSSKQFHHCPSARTLPIGHFKVINLPVFESIAKPHDERIHKHWKRRLSKKLGSHTHRRHLLTEVGLYT